MPSLSSDELVHQVRAAIAQLYPELDCRRSRQGLCYSHPSAPSTLSVSSDATGQFRILLEHAEPFAVIVSASTRSLPRLLDLVSKWREGR
jgi:hypothetical protein